MGDQEKLARRRRALVEAARTAPIIQTLGLQLTYADGGEAVWDMPYNPSFDHALGAIHGAVFATLLDNAGWFTVAPHYATWVATVEFETRLLEPVTGRDLRSIGRPLRLGRRIATATMEVVTPDDGRVVALGAGTFAVTSAAGLF